MNKYGFEENAWETAKTQATAVLRSYAKHRQMIPYSEFVTHVHAIKFEDPHDMRL